MIALTVTVGSMLDVGEHRAFRGMTDGRLLLFQRAEFGGIRVKNYKILFTAKDV